MTAKDYYAWADEYDEQIKIITPMISKLASIKYFKNALQRKSTERKIRTLQSMKYECTCARDDLLRIAKRIEVNENDT